LICSDGLSGVVSHQTMEDTLASYQGPQETVQNLIELALRGGGPDNITVIVADVLDIDSGDTLAAQLSDTPVVVGAVAENQHQLHDNGAMQTPAGRASSLGRPVPGQGGGGEFGPPGSGDTTGYVSTGGYGDYSDEDFVKPSAGRKWLKRSLYTALVLAVIGGGLYGGYQWTQTQYYVGTQDQHVALYRGISQDLAWVSLSKVEKDHPEIELKYLPPYQQKQVKATIAEGGLQNAQKKISELATQASACKKDAERRAADTNSAKTGTGQAGGTTGTTTTSLTSKATSSPSPTPHSSSSAPSSKPSTSAAPTPTPGPSLSDEEQKLVSLCGKQ
jgi:protein phosphatase